MTMKKNHLLFASLVAGSMLMAMTACDNDGDTIYTSGGDDVTLSGTTDDIVLDYNHLDALALTLYWTDNGELTLSDPRVAAPSNAITNTVEMAATSTFDAVVETTVSKGVNYVQYTVSQLNNLLGRIGFEGGVKAPLYIRIKSVLGNNLDPTYSNVMTLNVTPYVIDMTVGYYLDSNKGETSKTLYSANSDGIYEGFIGAGAWENWYLQEGNGVLWGNENVDWYAFKLGSDETAGNMWYPGISGCYYTIVNTQEALWSSLLINSLTLSGDLQGDMTYDRKSNKWQFTFDATPGTYTVTINGSAALYDVNTGTTDANAIAQTVGFGGTADALTFGETGSAVSVNVGSSGESCLTLDLSNPRQWTLSADAGGAEAPVEVAHYLYVTGIDDGITGSWGYSNYLIVCNEDALLYGGAINVNSLWGYVYMNEAFWGDGYGYESGDAMSGTINADTSSNIPAPEAGEYVFQVSLNDLTYKLFAIESVGYAGLNDDWTIREMTRIEPCVYEAEVEKTADTPWGVKIIINEDWDIFFGGGSGELLLYNDGFDGDNDLPNGSYNLTVDLNKGTYTYTAR